MLRIVLALLLLTIPASAQYIPGSGGGGGSGTVTSLSVVTANGFAGTVATATTTPAITLTTTVTGNVCSNATALSACTTTGTGSTVLAASPTITGVLTFPTPFTLGAVSVTSTGTQLNYLSAATGTTGTTSTNVVFSTSPTLVTPALGVATATSIAVNGATIGTNALAVTGNSLFVGPGSATGSGITISSPDGATSIAFQLRVTNSSAANGPQAGIVLSSPNSTNAADRNWATNTGVNSHGEFTILQSTSSSNDPSVSRLVITTAGQLNLPAGIIGLSSATAPDTIVSRNAAGVIQFGTTAANAAGAWLAAKGTLTGGTLADQAQVLAITATQPASPSAQQNAITTTITSAGSASQKNYGWVHTYNAGYTGSAITNAFSAENYASGTGTTLIPAAGSLSAGGNYGFNGYVQATTTGLNVGAWGAARDGNTNVGSVGLAQIAKNAATNIGVVGSAINTGTTPVQIGGFFSLNQTTVPAVSAALIADNGAQTDAIFLARDNGSTVFTIADGGAVITTNTISAGNSISTVAGGALAFSGRANFQSPADSILLMGNAAGTDFNRLQWGGTTSSFPAIKRSTTTLQVRLADDSADAGITMSTITASGITSITNATDSTTTTSGALQVAGGMAVRKRIFADGLTASAGLQTAVICQSSAGELIADSVACLASSERFKTILGSVEAGALDKLIRLPIYRWKYNEEGIFKSDEWTRERIGPTAEETAAIDPRLVGYGSDGKIRNISTEQLLALTIQAIQELKADNDNLRTILTRRSANGG